MSNKYARKMENLIGEIVLRLLNGLGSTELNISKAIGMQISIQISSNVNATSAFTINLGMLNLIENEDELAAVVAHELTHRLLNHATNIFSNMKPEQEMEADRFGTNLLQKANYNPFALYDLLMRIGNHPDYKPVSESTDTHPPILKRAEALAAYIQEHGWVAKSSMNSLKYRRLLSLFYFELSTKEPQSQTIIDDLDKTLSEIHKANLGISRKSIPQFIVAMRSLSDFFVKNPDLAARFLKERTNFQSFMSGALEIELPAWFDDFAIIESKIVAALEEIAKILLSITPIAGDVIDWYEFLTGRSFFDGKELDNTSRVLAGVGVILGSRQIFEGASQVVKRIIKDTGLTGEAAEKLYEAERISTALRELGWSGSKESIQDVGVVVAELRTTG